MVFELLKAQEFEGAVEQLRELDIHQVLNPLFSALCSNEDVVKWHGVTVMGILIADLAERDMEAARNVMRRFMWSLNDESGGIGWGIPEAMGEVMARHRGLADEFASILVSYTREDGNFLAYELLQRGVLWGIGRLAQVRPQLLQSMGAAVHLLPYLGSRDATVRGLAAWAIGLIGGARSRSGLENLLADEAEVKLYMNQTLVTREVRQLASEALELVRTSSNSPREGA